MVHKYENMELFNRICIVLFNRLYSAFPVPVDLNPNDVAMSAISEPASKDETWNTLSIAGEVISFLEEEGFLRHQGETSDGQYVQVRLTMKGLVVLGYVPSALEPNETPQPLISKVRAIVSGGLKEAGSESVRQLVSHAFSLALSFVKRSALY